MIRAILFIILVASTAVASDVTDKIIVNGRGEVILSKGGLLLEDLAEISSPAGMDDSLLRLKRIKVADAPAPGRSMSLDGTLAVDAMRSSGVDFSRVIYTFPKNIKVSRAGRKLTLDEIDRLVEESFRSSGRDITVRAVNNLEDLSVPPTIMKLTAAIQSIRGSDASITIGGVMPDGESFSTQARVLIDEWRAVPVASRGIDKGATINQGDIALARMKVSTLPRDVVSDGSSIIGYVTSSRVAIGEVLQQGKVEVPAVVTAGNKVTMLYRSKLFEASASGIALESGGVGQEIKIRNDHSKKVISGKINEDGTVVVSAN